MDTVILVLLLIFAVALIALVLLQRSEGGGLGIGGGGGMGGRPKANPMAKLTWYVAAGFLGCCLALTVISSAGTQNNSVFSLPPAASDDGSDVPVPNTDDLLPPSAVDDLTPPAAGDDLAPPAPSTN